MLSIGPLIKIDSDGSSKGSEVVCGPVVCPSLLVLVACWWFGCLLVVLGVPVCRVELKT